MNKQECINFAASTINEVMMENLFEYETAQVCDHMCNQISLDLFDQIDAGFSLNVEFADDLTPFNNFPPLPMVQLDLFDIDGCDVTLTGTYAGGFARIDIFEDNAILSDAELANITERFLADFQVLRLAVDEELKNNAFDNAMKIVK